MQDRNQRGGGPTRKFFAPAGKCVGRSLKILNIVQKIWAPLGKLFAPPGVPSWLRCWCRPAARFQVLVGYNTFLGGKIFAFTVCLKQIFLGAAKFEGHKKNLGGTAPECPPWLRAWPGVMQKIIQVDFRSRTKKSDSTTMIVRVIKWCFIDDVMKH